jgi:oligopeptidase B
VSDDELLFHETDELFRLNLYRTKDHAFIMLYLRSIETAEIHMLPADNPGADFTVIHPRQKGLRYLFEHHEGTFYVMSNVDAPNYKLMTTPVDRPGKEHWQEFIPHRDDVKLDSIDVFSQHLVLYERENGLRAMRVYDFGSGEFHNVSFPEPVYTYQEEENPEYDSRLLRFTYMSLTTPDTIYDYDMSLRSRELIKRKPVLGGFDPDDYASERVFAMALDGEQIPISLVYQKGMKRDGSNPCLLYGYGSYGYSIDPGFNSHRFSLIDRGIIYAIAHIRGGQEMGRRWYDQGKFLNKKNTFTDFIACGKALVEKNFTSHDKMAIMGRSAGGLLMGAVLNMAPDLAAVAVAGVPFVDVVTTMLDESIPLTVAEFEEWGNPKEPEYYKYMLSYSPYDNVTATHYPNILVTAGLNDPRVQYWEPAKWVARLRTTKVGNNRLLLKTNMGAGHAGASGRYDALKELAFEYAFILDTLGLHD